MFDARLVKNEPLSVADASMQVWTAENVKSMSAEKAKRKALLDTLDALDQQEKRRLIEATRHRLEVETDAQRGARAQVDTLSQIEELTRLTGALADANRKMFWLTVAVLVVGVLGVAVGIVALVLHG